MRCQQPKARPNAGCAPSRAFREGAITIACVLRDVACNAFTENQRPGFDGDLRPALQLLEKFAARARNVDPAGDAAFAIFHALNDAGFFAALGTCGRFRGIHDLFPVGCLCNFCHSVSPDRNRRRPDGLRFYLRFGSIQRTRVQCTRLKNLTRRKQFSHSRAAAATRDHVPSRVVPRPRARSRPPTDAPRSARQSAGPPANDPSAPRRPESRAG
jgi:hypothetical protein